MRKIIFASLVLIVSFNVFATGNGSSGSGGKGNEGGPGPGNGIGMGLTHEEYLKCDPVAVRYANQCHFATDSKQAESNKMQWPAWVSK